MSDLLPCSGVLIGFCFGALASGISMDFALVIGGVGFFGGLAFSLGRGRCSNS